ncbi:MAG TPA: glycosyltransferase [Candidatus Manganitrophaceae bacterium]|nr:glycosyltransferase [Candidatus Manganitrophaceae bacterium]
MIQGKEIICFANDWDGEPLSKKHIMRRLARRNRILWVDSIGNRSPKMNRRDMTRLFKKIRAFLRGARQAEENLYVFSPVMIPFYRSNWLRKINRAILAWMLRRQIRALGFSSPITWTFAPSSADVVGRLGERKVIYHCVDEFSAFSDAPRTAIQQMEETLLQKADLVIVSAATLLESKRKRHPNVHLVRHGVDYDHFKKALDPETPLPSDVASLPRPIIGFHGLIADWVDLCLIRKMALAHPEWSIVLLGGALSDLSQIEGLKNVHRLGKRPYEALPAYCKSFDVAILPFVVNTLTRFANPLKLREYLAAGLPVVATDLPEVRSLKGEIRIGFGHADFIEQVVDLLKSGKTGPSPERSIMMEKESWDEKVETLSALVEAVLAPAPEVSLRLGAEPGGARRSAFGESDRAGC